MSAPSKNGPLTQYPSPTKHSPSVMAVILVVLLLNLVAGCARARMERLPAEIPPAEIEEMVRAPAELPADEELVYSISWWGIPVGTAILTRRPLTPEEMASLGHLGTAAGRRIIRLRLKAFSNQYLQAFYPVRAELTSYFDPATRCPHWFRAMVRRQWRRHESTITFDWEKGTAFHRLPKDKSATVQVQPQTQDGLSLIAYARRLDFQVGQKVPLEISADGRNWHLDGRIVRIEMMKLRRIGERPAAEGQVQLAYPVPFFHGARASVWFSADEDRLPLLARIRSRIGPVTVVLVRRSSRSR